MLPTSTYKYYPPKTHKNPTVLTVGVVRREITDKKQIIYIMAYLNDPREQAIDIDNHVIWESDNRIEKRYQWGAMITDLCDMSPEEYMKNPLIEAVKAGGNTDELKDVIEESANKITDKIGEASDAIVEGNCECISDATVEITDAIYSAATIISKSISGLTPVEVVLYYTSVNNSTLPENLTEDDFTSAAIGVGSDSFINFILGDPTPEQWEQYINKEITEQELRTVAANDYYLSIPKAYKDKVSIQENGTVDLTDNFIEVENVSLFGDNILYRSQDVDYFNEDYESGETKVKIPFKITITK